MGRNERFSGHDSYNIFLTSFINYNYISMKTKYIQIRVTEKEHNRINGLAKQKGFNLSDYCRVELGLAKVVQLKKVKPMQDL